MKKHRTTTFIDYNMLGLSEKINIFLDKRESKYGEKFDMVNISTHTLVDCTTALIAYTITGYKELVVKDSPTI